MKLYLVQHGDAVPKDADPRRPLSARGQADVQGIASFLRQAGLRVPRILHSGKARAEQTAKLLAPAVGTAGLVERTPGIDPLDPTDAFIAKSADWTEDTMVVGHLPFVGKLTSRLLTGDESVPVVTFQPGSVLCLERGEDGRWTIVWMVRPELLTGHDVGQL